MDKISNIASDVAVSGSVFIYSDSKNLYYRTPSADEATVLIEGFAGTDLGISHDGSHFSFKTEGGCVVGSVVEYSKIRTEKCIGEIVWVSDSEYVFFEAEDEIPTDVDFFDDSRTVLVQSSVDSSSRKTQKGISANNSVAVAQSDNSTYVILTTIAEPETTICKLNKAYAGEILNDCQNLGVEITSITTHNGEVFGSARGLKGEHTISLSGDSEIFSNINLNKTFSYGSNLYALGEHNPLETVFVNILGSEKSLTLEEKFNGKRASSIFSIHKTEESYLVIEATNGLWGVQL